MHWMKTNFLLIYRTPRYQLVGLYEYARVPAWVATVSAGVLQFFRHRGFKNSENSMVAMLPTVFSEASIIPTAFWVELQFFRQFFWLSVVTARSIKVLKKLLFIVYCLLLQKGLRKSRRRRYKRERIFPWPLGKPPRHYAILAHSTRCRHTRNIWPKPLMGCLWG